MMRTLRRSELIPSRQARLRTGLLILYLALLLGISGLAQLGMASITIIPPRPTTADEITILLGGTWPNSCVPSQPEVRIKGSRILIETFYPSLSCYMLPTDWSLEVPIGRLPAGSYRVTVTYQQADLPPVVIGTAYFVVVPTTILLPQGADLVIYGPKSLDKIGHALMTGDFNGDGLQDLVIGNPWSCPNRSYILWGRERFTGEIDLVSFEEGITALEGFQADVLATGDINGDGLQDLIIGDTLADLGAGAVYVLLRGPELTQTASFKIEEVANLTVYGVRPIRPFDIPGDSLGYAMAVGDVDNDSFDDLVMGAPFTMRWDRQEFHAGAVYIVFGREIPQYHEEIAIVQGQQDLSIFAAEGSSYWMSPGDLLGEALAIADLNNDGLKDLIVRDPGPEEILIFWGREREGWPRVIDLAQAEPDATLTGIEPSMAGGGMDFTAINPGDFNGDGNLDLLVTQLGLARALLFFGPWLAGTRSAEEADVVITGAGAEMSSFFGYVSAVGDINGDGFDDFLVGAPNEERIYGFLGRADWPPRPDVTEGEVDLILEGVSTEDHMPIPPTHVPHTLAAQDFNGDGIDDILIGEPLGDGPDGRILAGRVYVVLGGFAPP